MAPRGYFTTGSLSAFICLGIIRGSFSIAIYFAVHSYISPSLIFLLRTPGAVCLYALFMVFLSRRDSEIKEIFYDNYRAVRNYWKFAVMGFVQLAAPYILFTYALRVLNPTTGGVYMAAAPWFSLLLERLPFVRELKYREPIQLGGFCPGESTLPGRTIRKVIGEEEGGEVSSPISAGKVGAVAVGVAGIILVSVSGIALASSSPGHCHCERVSSSIDTNNTSINVTIQKECCTPFTAIEKTLSLLALMAGSLMWSISSVFWRSNRGSIHYVSGGIGNNLFGGLFALILWIILQNFEDLEKIRWNHASAVFSIIFLTVISGWLAAIIVDYMYKEVGALVTNRVLCLVPLVAWFEDWMFVRQFKVMPFYWYIPVEVVGVVLVFVGLTISNLEPEDLSSTLRRPLLRSDERETPDTTQFCNNVRDNEDGVISDEEVKDTSYIRSCSTNSSQNPFPPLVEVTRQDHL